MNQLLPALSATFLFFIVFLLSCSLGGISLLFVVFLVESEHYKDRHYVLLFVLSFLQGTWHIKIP